MNDKSRRASEAADPTASALDSLSMKLSEFLMEQPEYLFILTHDRGARKRLGRMVGLAVSRIPRVGDGKYS